MHFQFFVNGVEIETHNLYEAIRVAMRCSGSLEGINPGTRKRFRIR